MLHFESYLERWRVLTNTDEQIVFVIMLTLCIVGLHAWWQILCYSLVVVHLHQQVSYITQAQSRRNIKQIYILHFIITISVAYYSLISVSLVYLSKRILLWLCEWQVVIASSLSYFVVILFWSYWWAMYVIFIAFTWAIVLLLGNCFGWFLIEVGFVCHLRLFEFFKS